MIKTNRYKELDALRGIAAMMVVCFHYTLSSNQFFFYAGTTGVDLFFMISGFVIFMSLNKINSSVEFVINRFCRLYPTYWASVTFTFLLAIVYAAFNKNASYIPIKLSDYIGNMTMFQFYLRIPDIDGPYWTMIIEMLFYIVMLIIYKRKLLASVNIIGLTLSAFTVILTFLAGDTVAVIRIMWWFPLLQFAPLFFAGTKQPAE